MEVGTHRHPHPQGVFNSDCDNLSISIIASTLLELFQGMRSLLTET